MEKFKDEPIVVFLSVATASSLTGLMVYLFVDNDLFKGIWTASFVFAFYGMGSMWESLKQEKFVNEGNLLFTNKFVTSMSFSIMLLIATQLITSMIWGAVIGDSICKRESRFYSEKQCSSAAVKEKYEGSIYSHDN